MHRIVFWAMFGITALHMSALVLLVGLDWVPTWALWVHVATGVPIGYLMGRSWSRSPFGPVRSGWHPSGIRLPVPPVRSRQSDDGSA